MRPLVALSLALACTSCKKKAIDASEVVMRELIRPPVALEVPDWEIVEDARDPALGKHKVQRETKEFVEVSWQGGEPMAAADLRALGRSLVDGFKLELVEDGTSDRPGEIHYELVAKLARGDRAVWTAMGLISCTATNVMITVGVGTWGETATRELYDRVMAKFRCIGDSPEAFRPSRSMPTSSLPKSYGYVEVSGNGLVIDAEGRGVFVTMAGGDTSGAVRDHPRKTLDTIGALIGMRITDVGKPRTLRGLNGVEMHVVEARGDGEPLVTAGYYCRHSRSTYTLVAIKDATATVDELTGLVTRFGCRGSGTPINERDSACDVGATAFCPKDGEAPAPPSGEPPAPGEAAAPTP